MARVAHPDYFIRLSAGFRSDLMWWKLFLNEWNGISLMRVVGKPLADVEVFQMHLLVGVVELIQDHSGFNRHGLVMQLRNKFL